MAIDESDVKQKEKKKKSRHRERSDVKPSSKEKKKHIEDDSLDVISDSGKKKKAKKRKSDTDKCDAEPCVKSKKSEVNQQIHSQQTHRKMKKRKDKFKDKVPDFLRLLQTKPPKVEEEPKVIPKTPEEIALEKMKDEKRERMRKKRQAKKQNNGKKIESTVAKDAALQYLTLWNTSKEIWRFQKVRQVWLLGHMYDTDMVSDANFDILLKYLEDLKGQSKVKTIEEAENILATAEEQGEEEEESSEDNSEEEEDEKEDKNSDEEKDKAAKKKKSSKETSKKEDVTSTEKYQRARQILQILT